MTDSHKTLLGIEHPIVQAPMAGVATPALAAAVSNAGGLGSLGVAAENAQGAARMISELKTLTNNPFNVNVFLHQTAKADRERETRWLDAMAPLFAEFGAEAPSQISGKYLSFAEDDDMLRALVELAPPVVSFHFGLPDAERIAALRGAGCKLLSTATSLVEAQAARDAGLDGVVAQGIEAGGHRGIFDPSGPDERMDTRTLARVLVADGGLPVIAAGGIMDGKDIAEVLQIGAVAAQLGTAFVGCPESAADDNYRKALTGPGAHRTVLTAGISGRPARCVGNRLTEWAERHADLTPPDYPIPYDAGKALIAAARAAGATDVAAQWAGTGAPRTRLMPAADLVGLLVDEVNAAKQS